MKQIHEEFMAWCNLYETAGLEVRSIAMHEHWIGRLSCPVLRLRAEESVDKLVREVVDELAVGRER